MNFKKIKKIKKHMKAPMMLDPIPLIMMTNHIVQKRNDAIVESNKVLDKAFYEYKKWFSIPYKWEYLHMNNNWLKRHRIPMRRRH